MSYAEAPGARIYFEETGRGAPILFLHEFGGDYRSWEPQVRQLSRNWRCITYSARGYPPSDCPSDESLYGQQIATRDAIAVLDAAKIDKAHLVGLSMGAYTALMCAVEFPGRVLSVTAAGGGSGAERDPERRKAYVRDAQVRADAMEKAGKIDAAAMGHNPTRVQLLDKDLRGWRDFVAHLAEHSAAASARILRKIQGGRASLYELEAQLKSVTTPIMLMVGDEDEPCLDVNLWMKRLMPTAQLTVIPGSGHLITLEEPALINQLFERFITSVERGTWRPRDPRARAG